MAINSCLVHNSTLGNKWVDIITVKWGFTTHTNGYVCKLNCVRVWLIMNFTVVIVAGLNPCGGLSNRAALCNYLKNAISSGNGTSDEIMLTQKSSTPAAG